MMRNIFIPITLILILGSRLCDPYGEHQFLSTAATAWATAGLAQLLPIKNESEQILLPQGSSGWKYVEGKISDRWMEMAFDDSAWKRGSAPLGFGEPTLSTIIRTPASGEDVPITTYFRSDFVRPDSSASLGALQFKIRVDDGCCVYLNGQECYRWNLPNGFVDHETLASEPLSSPNESLFRLFEIPADRLRSGRNVLAIEVHQCNAKSTDLYLDLRIHGKPSSVFLSKRDDEGAIATSLRFNSLHKIDSMASIPDGFCDGGRGMQIDEFGNAISGREVLLVDRSLDSNLNQHLAYARSESLMKLNVMDRATRIARYIDRLMTPEEGRRTCESRSEILAERYASKGVLIGDVVDLCGAGVCRHRSLLFKLMADEAKLPCNLVRGNFGTPEKHTGHTWNELVLDNQTLVVVDVMNPQPDFYFPAPGEAALRNYLTVANAVKYPPNE